MKTNKDPRHIKRIQTIKELFATSFHEDQSHLSDRTKNIIAQIETIDDYIKRGAPQWPVDKIGKIDLAILRQAVFELINDQDTPQKVIIDESIEIAKEYGRESSPKFINGVLGTILAWIPKTS